jgi:hypothetical protein
MSGYIVAPNPPATTGALSKQITVGSSTALVDPVIIPYTTFDGSANFTSVSGSLQTLGTSAITLPIGTYLIGTEVTIIQSGGAQFTTADSVYVGFYSTGATSLIYPSMTVALNTGVNSSVVTSFSGIMVLTTAATFTLQLVNNSSSTTNRSASWSGTYYQKIA